MTDNVVIDNAKGEELVKNDKPHEPEEERQEQERQEQASQEVDSQELQETNPPEKDELPDKKETDGNGENPENPGKPDRPNKPDEPDIPDIPDESDEPEVSVEVKLDPVMGQCSVESVIVFYQKTYGELPVPYRAGYGFQGWYDGKYNGNQISAETVVETEENHTLYAHWVRQEGFTLYFDGNGGRVRNDDMKRTVFPGEEYGTLPVPMREGYEFVGWYTAADGGDVVHGTDIFTGECDETLYAHWDYDAYQYWSYMLQNISEKMYACQKKTLYIELEEEHTTLNSCELISNTSSINIARKLEDVNNVEDEWVAEQRPDGIIKIGGSKAAMQGRFPDSAIYVVPAKAVYGSSAEMLYFQLYLGQLLYPDWYNEVNIGQVASELGVSGTIN